MSLVNLIMPAVDQSTTSLACTDVTEGEIRDIAATMAQLADPRRSRGVRHAALGLLMGVMVAVLAGPGPRSRSPSTSVT